MSKICFFTRSPIHYRKAIWMLMDEKLPCDFYFGDLRPGNIKPLDVSLLKNFKGWFHNVKIGPFYWQKGALKLLRSDYTDIITQGDTYSLTAWAFVLLGRLFGKNIYLWTHGAYGDEGWFKRWVAVLGKKGAKGVFLYGNHARELLIKWGVPEEKLHLIYNSLDYDRHHSILQKIEYDSIYLNHFGNSNYNLVFIGRLTKIKKLDQVLKAMAILRNMGENYNITFVGDGSEKLYLQELAAKLDLSSATWFYGACYDEEQIGKLLYNADLCVSPGNVGLTAMHAMTFGCPVISNDNFSTQMPEYEAIQPGQTGDFFHENDIDSLANTIKGFHDNHCNQRDAIRMACYKVIEEKYNPHVQIETLKRVICN